MAHHHHEHAASSNSGNLALAFFLNVLFSLIELVGGLLTNSMAILSDALHDAGDSLSLGMAWYFQRLSKRKPTSNYTYGFRRLTLVSALINSVVLLTGSAYILVESLQRLFQPADPNAKGMFLLAILGIIVNGFAALRLRKGNNLNERVVSLHLLEDVLGWIAVLIGSLVMMVATVPWLDPALSIGISVFILYNVVRNLRSATRVLLQGKPDEVDEKAIKQALLDLPYVTSLHDLHIWSMDADFLVLSVHLVVEDGAPDRAMTLETITTETVNVGTVPSGNEQNQVEASKASLRDLRQTARNVLKTMGIKHATIELEYESENCEWCEPVV